MNGGRKTDLRRTLKHGEDAQVAHTHNLVRTKLRHKPVSSNLEMPLSWPKPVGTDFKNEVSFY